ncbi:MAG: hypothetical protein LBN95_04620 [Prevotellaceae bacterium]|nr:hypothetical protein [Prevotellaceae bacterium]
MKFTRQNIRNDKRLLLLAAIGFLSMFAVIVIKGFLRDWHLHLSPIGIFLQGTLPNFFAGTGICAMFFSVLKNNFGINTIKSIIYAFLITFFGLTFWELLQYLIWAYPVDIYDIMMSFIGCVLIVILVLILYRKECATLPTCSKLPKNNRVIE